MNNTVKQCVIGGVCALTLGGAMLCADSGQASDMVIAIETQSASDIAIYENTDTSYSSYDSGIIMSFTAAPESSMDGMALFSTGNGITILSDIEDYTPGETMNVSGVIKEVRESVIVLCNCVVAEGDNDPVLHIDTADIVTGDYDRSPADITDEMDTSCEADMYDVTVYVSSSGKYHSKPDCSGMKSFTEMQLSEALADGCVSCKRCY